MTAPAVTDAVGKITAPVLPAGATLTGAQNVAVGNDARSDDTGHSPRPDLAVEDQS